MADRMLQLALATAISSPAWAADPQSGWPVLLDGPTTSSNNIYQPTVADLTGDGLPEVIFTCEWLGLFVLSGDGEVLPGWPFAPPEGAFRDKPLVGDIDGDGELEIIVESSAGPIFALDTNGLVEPGWPIEISGLLNDGRLCLGDLNGDGAPELIARTRTGYVLGIHVVEGDGTPLSGWPVELDFTSVSGSINWIGPAVGDLDFDGDEELIVPTSNVTLVEDFSSPIYVFEHDGSIREGWPAFPPPPVPIQATSLTRLKGGLDSGIVRDDESLGAHEACPARAHVGLPNSSRVRRYLPSRAHKAPEGDGVSLERAPVTQ